MKKYHLLTKPLGSLFLAANLLLAGQSATWAQQRPEVQQLPVQQFAGQQSAGQQSAVQLPNIVNTRPDAARQAPVAPPASVKAIPARPGPFERYVHTVTGADLSVFGRSLFNDVPSTFAPIDSAPVNPDYVIGSGDELQIRGWGMVDIDINTTVDRSGAVNIPRIGSVKVAGIKYRDLQGYLTKAVAKLYNNFELTASVSQTRAVQVYVVGHAVRPGTYTLSAMSTLLNALFTSGGPDAAGSMRNIQVKRGTEVVTNFDLYDMLISGDKSKDVTLRDGDVIYIPEVGPLVALAGNVKQPAIFELKGSASLADVMHWAGGFDSSTENKPIIVEKSVNNSYQVVSELPANNEAVAARLGNIRVGPTDILRVFAPGAVPVQIQLQHEYVTVAGEMKQSGVFEIKKGETLRDLVARLGGPTDNGYIFATKMVRDSVRRSQQDKLDQAADRFEHDFETTASERLAHATDKDSIAVINADLDRQRRTAQKLREVKAEGRIVLELAGSAAQVKDLPDLPLQDGDSIFVPRRPGTVEVIGTVYQPNSTLYRPSRTVSDYLALAGGPTSGADTDEMYLIRADGAAKSNKNSGWFTSLGGAIVNPGDTIVVPEKINRTSWVQSFKEWTTILYQFGLGAAGLKVLQN
jgi:protein involved in polysaccharide export with SLBB domain